MKQLSAFWTSGVVTEFLVFLSNLKDMLGDCGVTEELDIDLIISNAFSYWVVMIKNQEIL